MNQDIIGNLYEEMLETNIIAMFSCYKPMWIHPKNLKMRRTKEYDIMRGESIKIDKGDPYVTASYNKTFDLGMDLLKNGTYWPFLVNEREDGFYVREGNHRIAAIKILIEQNKWPQDKPVFCMVYSKNVYDPSYKLKIPVEMLKIKLDNEGKPLKELIIYKCIYAVDVMHTFNFSTPYFRNWIWDQKLFIKPYNKINKFKYYKDYYDNKYKVFWEEYYENKRP